MADVTLITTGHIDLGIRSISAYLRSKGYSTNCLFLSSKEPYTDSSLESIAEKIAGSNLVGISTLQITYDRLMQLLNLFRESDIPVVVGGYDATVSSERYTNDADYICLGDGEVTILKLLESIESGNPPEKGVLPINIIPDLNSLPLEDYDTTNHFIIGKKGILDNPPGLREYPNPRVDTRDSIYYLASRGCIYSCSFCHEPAFAEKISHRKIRIKSPSKVIGDLENIVNLYPQARKIYFLDPDFFIKPQKWLKQFSETYESAIGLPFWTFGNPNSISEKKVGILRQAGLVEVEVGVQSGSERINLDIYRRKTPNDLIANAVKILLDHEIMPILDVMYDNPYETQDDLLKTIYFLVSLPKPFELGTFGLDIMPGTEIHKRASGDGLLIERDDRNYHNRKVKSKNNTYLNFLIRLMAGRCTEERLGLIPIELLPTLTRPNIIAFMDANPDWASALDSVVMSNPEIIFDKMVKNIGAAVYTSM